MDEDVDYDSDHIDEDIEARLYSSIFHDNDVEEPPKCQLENLPTPVIEITDGTSSSTSDDLSSTSDKSDDQLSTAQPCGLADKNILMEALFLAITGTIPHRILQKADDRMNRFMERSSVDAKDLYESTSDSSTGAGLPFEKSEPDLILGVSGQSVLHSKSNRDPLSEILEGLPSDRKYWSLDPSDTRSSFRRIQNPDHDIICRKCLRKGHRRRACAYSGPLCYLCGQEGHTFRECPKQCCSICIEFGHTSLECTKKRRLLSSFCSRCNVGGHNSELCADVWRQYRYTTEPGKPVIVNPPPLRRAWSCFNCGACGHTGDYCRKPTLNGTSLFPTSIYKFDDYDVYANARSPCPDRSSQTKPRMSVGETPPPTTSTPRSAVRGGRIFDEPLYCALEKLVSPHSPPSIPSRESWRRNAGRKRKRGEISVTANHSPYSRKRKSPWKNNDKVLRNRPHPGTSFAENELLSRSFGIHNTSGKAGKRKPSKSLGRCNPLRQSVMRNRKRPMAIAVKSTRRGGQRKNPRLALLRTKKKTRKRDLPNISTSPYVNMLGNFETGT